MGTVGLVFDGVDRGNNNRVGWCQPNENIKEVDIVGHSWFFRRDWLRYYALEPRVSGPTCGEDYHMSVAIQKHLGLKTYVPPHPKGDKSLWGSTAGHQLGSDGVGLWQQQGEGDKKKTMHRRYLDGGWKLINQRT